MNKNSKFLASPYIVWMAIFIIVPLVLIAVFACTTKITVDADGNRLTEEQIETMTAEFYEENGEDAEIPEGMFVEKTIFSWENLLSVSTYMPTLISSIWLAFIATLICLLLGYPVAYIISRINVSKQKMMIFLMMIDLFQRD